MNNLFLFMSIINHPNYVWVTRQYLPLTQDDWLFTSARNHCYCPNLKSIFTLHYQCRFKFELAAKFNVGHLQSCPLDGVPVGNKGWLGSKGARVSDWRGPLLARLILIDEQILINSVTRHLRENLLQNSTQSILSIKPLYWWQID